MRSRAAFLFAWVLAGFFLFSGCWNSPEIPNWDNQNAPGSDTESPTVAVTSPPAGATVSGTVTISADAADNIEVKFVEFFADNIKLQNGTVTSPPFEYQWNTGSLAAGSSHNIYAKATDTSGNTKTSPVVPVTIGGGGGGDTTPPTVAITSPLNNATVSGTVNINADASDNVGVQFVEFFLDGAKLQNSTDYSAPYVYQWDASALPAGSGHSLYARAVDTSGNPQNSATITVTIAGGGGDTTPPSVVITIPANAATVSGNVNITADATDNVGIQFVEFFLDGAQMNDGIEYNYPYEQLWDTSVHPNGSAHLLYTKATDTSNNVAYSDTIQVTVDNGGGAQPLTTDANVIVLVIDGARYTETFGEPTHTNVKFMWNYMKPQASFFSSFRNEGTTSTNPGHSSIATSTWQTVANDGTERPDKPTFFEYLRKQYIVQQSETYVVMGKTKLNICSYGTYPGYGSAYGSSVDAIDRSDASTYQALIGRLQTDHPRLTFVNFASVDRKGHTGVWADYIDAIQTADSLAYELWQFIESDAFYSGKTYLFITNDHGRHTTNFTSHGDGCEGCRHLMCLALGPTIKPNYTVSATYTQVDICPTVGSIFGFTSPYGTGIPISEIFSVPLRAQAAR